MASSKNNLIPPDFEDRYQRAFGLLAFTVNRHVVDHMRRMRVELLLDPETAQIWGTLAHMNVLPNLPLGANPMEILDELGRSKNFSLTPIRLTELSQVTGLPRETIRRKLELLQSMGKAERHEEGGWVYRSAGVSDLEVEFTRKTVLQFLQTAQALLSILDKVDVKSEFPRHR